MGRKYLSTALVGLLWITGAYAEVNTLYMPDYVLPHQPDAPGEILSREGLVWVKGAMLSSPCSSGSVMAGGLGGREKTPSRSVVLLLEGCGDGIYGGGARLPVTVDVMSGVHYLTPRHQVYRVSHGNSTLPLYAQPDAQVLRVEMRYE